MDAKQHRWRIADEEYERQELRRGRRHAFTRFTTEQTALVVVDMVSFFVEANAYAQGIVPRLNDLSSAFRSVGAVVAWVVPEPDPDAELVEEFFGREIAARYQGSGGSGTIRDRLCVGIETAANDIYSTKTATSAFFPGRCDLHEQLVQHSVENVVVAGTVANVCVEATARDARTMGYRVVAAADVIAAPTDDVLNATLRTIYRSYGDVRTTQEIKDLVRAADE